MQSPVPIGTKSPLSLRVGAQTEQEESQDT
jgi:hypothetical protein